MMPSVRTEKPQQQPRADQPLVELHDVCLSFGRKIILDHFSLTLNRNEVLTIVGPSGTGKSTLVKIITGLLEPDSGEVIVRSDRIGLAFQSGALFTSLTVAENIVLVLERTTDLDDIEIEKRVDEALKLVGLETEADKMPDELSGGMQKRVGIARALAIEPEIMLYDEPSAGLDPILANRLEKDLRRINEERGMGTLLVSHELPTIENMADRVLMLYEGKVVYQGTKDDFFTTREPHALQFRTRRETGPIDA